MLKILLENILNHDLFGTVAKQSMQKLHKNHFYYLKSHHSQVNKKNKKMKFNTIFTKEEKNQDKNIFSCFLNNYLTGICNKKNFLLDVDNNDVNILHQVKKK